MNNTYCAMAWGQGGMRATPLSIARAYSIIANEGNYVPTRYTMNDQPKPVPFIDAASAKELWEDLTFTAHEHDHLTNFSTFGGKTGTPVRPASSSIFSHLSKGQKGIKNDAWYAFIVKSPKGYNLAVAIRIERSYRASTVAKEWVRDLVMKTLKDYGYVNY